MNADVYLKTTCRNCGGHVEFLEEQEGATVPCPHCGKYLFLYRDVRAVATPAAIQPVYQRPTPLQNQNVKLAGNSQTTTVLRVLGLICYVFGLVDFAGMFFHYDITGVPWSPIVAGLIGSAFIGIGNAKEKESPLPAREGGFSPNPPVTSVEAADTPIPPLPATYYHANSGKPLWAIISFVILVLLIAVGAIVYFVRSGGGLTTEKLEAEVRHSIQDKFLKDPNKAGTQIKSFRLVHESGSKYKGILEIQNGQQSATEEVDVTYDGRNFMWETVPSSVLPASNPTPTIQETSRQDWNTSENDAAENGNIAVAVNWIRRNSNLRQRAIAPQPQMVAKTPYNYYGQIVKLTGTVAVVQDFPSGSDFGQSLGGQNASDIVTMTADGTIVELFCMKSSGNMRIGDAVYLYGYPVGVTDVQNRLGGNDVHLIVVGNDYDDLGAAQ